MPPEPDPASLDAASRAVLLDDDLWHGTPPEPRPAWADEGAAAWDDWSREGARSRPVVMPVVVMAAVVAAVTAALTAAPGPVIGTPTAVVNPAPPVRKAIVPAEPPSAMPTTTPAADAPPPPRTTPKPKPPPAPPREQQAPGTVRLAQGGTATLVRKDVVDGVLPVPEGVREATWWGAGFDGTAGATVLAGHVNWKGATGPFAELWESRVGDVVTVVDARGATHRYRVRELVTVHKDQLPARARELFGQDGPHRLVLVTCGGRWVGGSDGYEENRVVIAQPL